MRYACAVLVLISMGAVLSSGHRQDRHTTLVCLTDGTLREDGFSMYAYEYWTPELAAAQRILANGQEFRRSYPGWVWLLTRACLRQWVYVPAGEHTLNITVGAVRSGYVPPAAYAVCHVGTPVVGYAPPSNIGSDLFGLAGEMPEVGGVAQAYANQITVTGPAWVVVSASTETVTPNVLWPQGERYAFAVQLVLNAWVG